MLLICSQTCPCNAYCQAKGMPKYRNRPRGCAPTHVLNMQTFPSSCPVLGVFPEIEYKMLVPTHCAGRRAPEEACDVRQEQDFFGEMSICKQEAAMFSAHYLGAVYCVSLFPSWLYLSLQGRTVAASYLGETLQPLMVGAALLLLSSVPVPLGPARQVWEPRTRHGLSFSQFAFPHLPSWILRDVLCH